MCLDLYSIILNTHLAGILKCLCILIKLISTFYVFMYSLNFCPGPKGNLILSSVSLCTMRLCVGRLASERVWFGIDLARHMLTFVLAMCLHNTLYNYVDLSTHMCVRISENLKMRERVSSERCVYVMCGCGVCAT